MPRLAALSRRLRVALLQQPALVSVGAFWVVLLLVALPQELVQDSWLTLLSGREVAHHGLPATDHLTVWSHGAHWVDQQWLGQLAFYGLYVLGGVRAVLLTHAALLAATVFVGMVAARRLGASQASVSLGAVASLAVAPWALQMRAQSIAQLLFVLVLWLLAADSRSPGRRVFLVLPLLVLWANVHGTVVLGAGLVALRGLTLAWTEARAGRGVPRRAALLVFVPVGCLFASPYGISLGGYYHRLLMNPTLRWFIDEWRSSTPSHKTATFYVLAFATVWLLGRYRSRLTSFEQLALLSTLLGAVLAIRSIIWFGLCCLVLLPPLLDGALERLSFSRLPSRLGRTAPALLVLVAAIMTGWVVSRPAGWYTAAWPTRESTTVARLVRCNSRTRVFADDRYADWLLWTFPELRGRVAYDVRFELFTPPQFLSLYSYRNRVGDDWRKAARGYDLIVFDPRLQETVERGMVEGGPFVRRYADAQMVILAARARDAQARHCDTGATNLSERSAARG